MRMPFWSRKPAENRELVDRLTIHVDRLAGLIGRRHLFYPEGFFAGAGYVKQEFAKLGDAVQSEDYLAFDHEVSNIYIERTGTTKPKEVVIVGAHYDTELNTPGADDNASAVAMLIEVARLLRNYPCPRTIRFVSFACEEAPHFFSNTMGSRVHVGACRARGEQVTAMICLEMVGYFSDEPGSQRVPPTIPTWLHWAFPRRGNFLAAVGNMSSLWTVWQFRRGFKRTNSFPLLSLALPEKIREIRLSDNSSFWDAGYPALMITDTSFLRNPHYHRASDTPDTLDYARMGQATLGVAGGVARLAGYRGRIAVR